LLITRTPLRITLGGGGTDIPEFYEKHGGFWINTTIDKYIYVALKRRFEKALRVAYSQVEEVDDPRNIQHPIFREVFNWFNIWQKLEVSTVADLPSRTGLGSSGAFTVGLINALYAHHHSSMDLFDKAELAYTIERHKLQRSVGKQDQYSAAFGGSRIYNITKDGKVSVGFIPLVGLDDHLMLIYTGRFRDSEEMLSQVKISTEQLLTQKEIAKETMKALMNSEWDVFGSLTHDHWQNKKEMARDMSTHEIDKFYTKCRNLGAYGGKLVGAGGGGFFMLVVPNKDVKHDIQKSIYRTNFINVPFKFTYQGTEVMQW